MTFGFYHFLFFSLNYRVVTLRRHVSHQSFDRSSSVPRLHKSSCDIECIQLPISFQISEFWSQCNSLYSFNNRSLSNVFLFCAHRNGKVWFKKQISHETEIFRRQKWKQKKKKIIKIYHRSLKKSNNFFEVERFNEWILKAI